MIIKCKKYVFNNLSRISFFAKLCRCLGILAFFVFKKNDMI